MIYAELAIGAATVAVFSWLWGWYARGRWERKNRRGTRTIYPRWP